MDVDGQTNLPEGRMNGCGSRSSNYRYGSQSRKISIGVLIDSVYKAETKDLKEPVMKVAENETCSKGNCEPEGHTPLAKKHVTVEQKDTSPWVSTRSLNPKVSSSVAVQDKEHTPIFPATSRRRPRSKLLEKASSAHSLKFFAANTGSEFDESRTRNCGKSMEAGKANNAEHVKNFACSTELGVPLEKDQVEHKHRTTETGGSETLRMKLWEILGNVSSPNKHFPSSQCVELHQNKERDGKQSPTEKINPDSDTIESDSQIHIYRRRTARSLTRRKAPTKDQSNKTEATKSTVPRKECPRKRICSSRGDWSGRLYDNFDDVSLPSKRNKIVRMSSGVKTHQGRKCENAEVRQLSEKSRSKPELKKSMVHKDKVFNASSFKDGGNDEIVEPKNSTKNNTSVKPPLNVMTDQKDVEQPMDVEVSKKNQQEDIFDSLFKNQRNSPHDPSTLPSEIKSHGCLPKSKQGKLYGESPAKKIFNTEGIRSFKSLMSSKSTECKPNVQLEPSDGRCEPNDSPKNSLLVKPSIIMDEDGENSRSKSSTDENGSESSEDESHMKGCRESEGLSPEICLSVSSLRSPSKSLGNDKDVEATGYSPAPVSLKGIQDSSELQMYFEQNHEDGLDRAVALFTIALDRVKTKLKSISNRKAAEILHSAVEEIFLRLQNAESLIKKDVEKLTNLIQLRRKQLETRFQEQQEQLLGIYTKFKEEVDQKLLDYGSLMEGLEEHEIELTRSVGRQRAAHKKVLSQVEQEINVQLDDAESRIMAVQEFSRKKMLQLKLGIAECVEHGAFG